MLLVRAEDRLCKLLTGKKNLTEAAAVLGHPEAIEAGPVPRHKPKTYPAPPSLPMPPPKVSGNLSGGTLNLPAKRPRPVLADDTPRKTKKRDRNRGGFF
jgi:hypothetical protein